MNSSITNQQQRPARAGLRPIALAAILGVLAFGTANVLAGPNPNPDIAPINSNSQGWECLLSIPAAANPTSAMHWGDRYQSVSAAFESYDATGCILTSAFVVAANDFQSETGTPQTATRQVSVSVSKFDICNGLSFFTGNGFAEADLKIDSDLNRATLKAVVPLFDDIAQDWFAADVELHLSGTGPLVRDRDLNVDDSLPGITITTRWHGDVRDAQAEGTVNAYDHPRLGSLGNLAPEPSFFALIQKGQSGTLTITRECP